jgi:hypothetical protein
VRIKPWDKLDMITKIAPTVKSWRRGLSMSVATVLTVAAFTLLPQGLEAATSKPDSKPDRGVTHGDGKELSNGSGHAQKPISPRQKKINSCISKVLDRMMESLRQCNIDFPPPSQANRDCSDFAALVAKGDGHRCEKL